MSGEKKLIKQFTPIHTLGSAEFILPNNSGDHVRSIKRDTPVADVDLVNKTYVDNHVKLANHPHQDVNTTASPTFVNPTATTYKLLTKTFVSNTGTDNTFIGEGLGTSLTTGSSLVLIGTNAAKNITTGKRSVIIGSNAAETNLATTDNAVVIGYNAGKNATSAGISNSVIIGTSAGYVTEKSIFAVGVTAGEANTTGECNFFFGNGAGALNTTGTENLYLGNGAGKNGQGCSRNCFIGGYRPGYSNTGNYNIGIGSESIYQKTSGDENTCVGWRTGYNMGTSAGNVFLGSRCGFYETGSNKLMIDNVTRANEADGRIKALIYGEFNSTVSSQILRFNAETQLYQDSLYFKWGAGADCGIMYNGTDMNYNSQLVGTGEHLFNGGSVRGNGGFKSSDGSAGISVTITTAAITVGGAQGSMTFKNGLLTAQTPAT